jgi:ribose 5-phosphate isomerase A
LLGARVREGLQIIGVPTSEQTAQLARELDIPLTTLDEEPELDLCIDGADEFDADLRLIKGGGGALLREKIVAVAARRMIVIADASKEVAILGRFPLPIEVIPFGLTTTRAAIARAAEACGCVGDLTLRRNADGTPFLTDGGHLILDGHFGQIDQPERLATALKSLPGVVEHGLFVGIAAAVIKATAQGATILGHPEGA